VGAGIDDLMGLTVRAFVPPGGVAVTSRGTYPTFEYHVAGYGGKIERVDYRADGTLDLDGLLARVRETDASLVYLANPDNPSGTFLPGDEITRFYEALPRGVVLFLDEAYVEFAGDAKLLPLAFEDRIIRARTFSKVYGLAGARVGYALTSQQNVETFQKIRLHFGVNRNAQVGALAALHDEAFAHYVIEETARGRDEYYALAEELGLPWLRSATNFVCLDLGSERRATQILGELFERGVWIRKPGAPPLDRFIRVSVGTPPMRASFAEALRAVLAEAPVGS
jgi:histidinol-phosphate aminotransferase